MSLSIWSVVRYAMVGGVATFLHVAVAWSLMAHVGGRAQIANGLAFFVAFVWSFAGNYYWSFKTSGGVLGSMMRFFLVSLLGFAVNAVTLEWLVVSHGAPPRVALAFSSLLVPVLTFLATSLWAFKGARDL